MMLSAAQAICQNFPIECVRAVCSPVNGIATKNKFAPNLAELRNALEVEYAPIERQIERERAWANARALPAPVNRETRKTYEQIQAELAEAGIFIGEGKAGPVPMKVADIQEKYGITKEQWDAIPNAKCAERNN